VSLSRVCDVRVELTNSGGRLRAKAFGPFEVCERRVVHRRREIAAMRAPELSHFRAERNIRMQVGHTSAVNLSHDSKTPARFVTSRQLREMPRANTG
jgi:hypothetical protein